MSSSSAPAVTPLEYRPTLADFELLKLIGQGYSGLVYLALERLSRKPVALKIVKKGHANDSRILSEQTLSRSLSGCSFILPLLASWHDANNFYLVFPFHGGHDMSINLAVESRFNEDRARFYAAELLVALEEMKARKIIHRDIKPANILFTAQGHIRLIDLGFATKLKASPITEYNFDVDPNACSGSFKILDPDYTSAERVGTPSYMSPDQHIGRPYSFEADLHALGVTIYQMLTGRFPFGEGAKTREEIFESVLCDHLSFRPEDKVSDEARDLLARLLERDSKRPAQLEEIVQHPWFAAVRWDRIRTEAISPSWKPHLSPLPKNTTSCVVNEGSPCSPDPHPGFTYVSPEFTALRARRDESILNRLVKLFSRDQLPPPPATPPSTSSRAPSASPSEVRTEVPPPSSPPVPSPVAVSSVSSQTSTKSNPPPTPPPNIPLPSLPTVVVASSTRPPQEELRGIRGDLPPLHIRQQLAKRARPPPKARPIRGDMTLMPQLIITPADDDVEECSTDAPPAPRLRLPLADVTNQRLLSPSDAERPAFNPVLKPGPRIKLAAPPKRSKRSKRAQKENAPPQSLSQAQPKTKVARTPPTAVFMLPPKNVPLPFVMPAPALSQTPKKVAVKPKDAPRTPLITSPPKSATSKVKPAFKVPVKVTEPKTDTPRSLVKRSNSVAKSSTSSIPSRPVDLADNQETIYPRPLARAQSLSHPALAFVDSKEKPADYPRPPEGATQSRELAPVKPLSIEEAFAPPPASPPRPKATPKNKNMAPAPTFTSAPQACGVLNLSSAVLSKESLAGFYGLSSPRINLDPQVLKKRTGEIIERARSSIKDKQDGLYLSARAASPPILVGPHYAGYLPGPSSTGIISDVRRLWIRFSMAVSRAISWLRYCGEPGYSRL